MIYALIYLLISVVTLLSSLNYWFEKRYTAATISAFFCGFSFAFFIAVIINESCIR